MVGTEVEAVVPFLQPGDALGDGARRQCQLGGGGLEAAGTGDGVEGEQRVVVLPRLAHGYKDQQLKMHARITHEGSGTPRTETQTVIWRWNGTRYEVAP